MKDALNAGSTITFADSGTAIFLENSTTNVTGFDVDYTVNFGDGTTFGIDGNAAPGGVGAARTTHTFSNAAETDTQYTINLSLDSHPAADPNVIPASDSATFKVYSEHTPSFTGITTIGINSTSNSGLPITFTNTTESTIGSLLILESDTDGHLVTVLQPQSTLDHQMLEIQIELSLTHMIFRATLLA